MIGAIIGGAVGALGGLLGSAGKNEQIRKQMALLAKQQKENQDWYDRRYNEDATQRADAQRLLQTMEDSIRKRNKAAAGREAVMGGASESTAREKEAGNQMMANAVGQINANNERRKDAIEAQYRNQKAALEQQEAGLEGQKVGAFDYLNNIIGGAAQGASLGMSFK